MKHCPGCLREVSLAECFDEETVEREGYLWHTACWRGEQHRRADEGRPAGLPVARRTAAPVSNRERFLAGAGRYVDAHRARLARLEAKAGRIVTLHDADSVDQLVGDWPEIVSVGTTQSCVVVLSRRLGEFMCRVGDRAAAYRILDEDVPHGRLYGRLERAWRVRASA